MIQAPSEQIALLMIVAGPAGSGKTTLCETLVKQNPCIERVVTCTTRPPRPGEVDGVDYHFLSNETFDRYVKQEKFLEWAKVHTNRYGSLKRTVHDKLEAGVDLVINVDVQGVTQFLQAAETDHLIGQRLVTVFLYPSDLDQLRQRLRGRGSDDEAEIEVRMSTAQREIARWKDFEYVVITGTREADYQAVHSIWLAEKHRANRLGGL